MIKVRVMVVMIITLLFFNNFSREMMKICKNIVLIFQIRRYKTFLFSTIEN